MIREKVELEWYLEYEIVYDKDVSIKDIVFRKHAQGDFFQFASGNRNMRGKKVSLTDTKEGRLNFTFKDFNDIQRYFSLEGYVEFELYDMFLVALKEGVCYSLLRKVQNEQA